MMSGGAGADQLVGDVGNDQLYGGEEQDVLTGGTGNDLLNGGTDADTYHFKLGDGQDKIIEVDSSKNIVRLDNVSLDSIRYINGVLYYGTVGDQIMLDPTKIASWMIHNTAFSTQQLNRMKRQAA